MYIALLGKQYLKRYKGIFRKFPDVPYRKETMELWLECIGLTEGAPVKYSLYCFEKLYKLYHLLRDENGEAWGQLALAGGGKEPIHHPKGSHGNEKPHYHPNVKNNYRSTPHGASSHDHYYYPR